MNQLLTKHRKVIAFLIWMFWIPVILFCAHELISLRSRSIFSFILLSIALIFILFVIGRISLFLEKENNYTSRIIKQFLYGFLLPLLLLVIFAQLYNLVIDSNLAHNALLIKELVIVIVYLYMANSFYLIIHMDRKFSKATLPIEKNKSFHDKVVVYHKGAYGPINLIEIALIDQRNQINWLITFKEEKHILDLSLKEINDVLGTNQFFKINRSQIVNKAAISNFRSGSFGKIDLILNVNAISTTISKDRAKDFRKWFYK